MSDENSVPSDPETSASPDAQPGTTDTTDTTAQDSTTAAENDLNTAVKAEAAKPVAKVVNSGNVKTVRTSVEVTKTDDGTWLNIELGGRKIALSLDNSNHGPMVSSVLKDWGASHFKPKPFTSKALTLLGELLVSTAVSLVLLGVVGGAIWMIYANSHAMAQGFGMALGAGILGSLLTYLKSTRSILGKIFSGGLFQ